MSPEGINQSLIVLIPKIKKPMHASHFRPISLCNVIFKVITKTIANRLKLVLSDVISEAHRTFVPGRLITDNSLISFKCLYYIQMIGWSGSFLRVPCCRWGSYSTGGYFHEMC